MREILFRGKRIDNGEWVEGYFYRKKHKWQGCDYFISDDAYITTGIHEGYGGMGISEDIIEWEVIPETVGQYTGLTDKNGTKIFEGDVVEICFLGRTTRHLVEFDDEYRCGWFPFACGDGCGCCETDTYSPSDGEVIGNIHDNPELLKGETDA